MSRINPFTEDRTWLAWKGMETDLIFNRGYDLSHFAAFPMIDSEKRSSDALHFEQDQSVRALFQHDHLAS